MDVLMVFIAIIGIAVSIASKVDKTKAQQRRAAAPEKGASGPKTAASQNASTRTSSSSKTTAPSKFPTVEPSKYPPAAAPKRPNNAAQKSAAYGGTPRYTHVVTSTLEGGHTHTESSMTGEEACPPPKVAASKPTEAGKGVSTKEGALLSFQTNSVLQGFLYAEILGKPKALQGK